MKIEDLQNKKILIVGYGKEGKATEEFLKATVPNLHYAIADESQGEDYLANQKDYDLAIRTPGVHKSLLTIPHTTATNIFFANLAEHTTIGVTGTKGKSTTASLIAHIINQSGKKVKLIGNIGNPMLNELIHKPEEKTIYVCELSSYQLDDIEYSPHISIIVSLFPDHLTYHKTLEEYFTAKKQLILHATKEDYFVYNPAFQKLADWTKETLAQGIPYETDLIPTNSKLIGAHNIENMKAAITTCRLLSITDDEIVAAIATFNPLPHRLQFVGTFKGISFYDDAISTTPESTIAGLNSISNVKTILLGGLNRGYDFTELAKALHSFQIPNVVLFPDSGSAILEAIHKINDYKPNILETQDMEKAVQFAYANTPQNGVCLLSTASPSYSIWKNFEEKGNMFQTFVKQYAYEKKNS